MNIQDAQSKDAPRARVAIIGLLSRGAYIKAFRGGASGRSWTDYHLIIDGQRYEANRAALKGVAESCKTTIVDNCKGGFVCFHTLDTSTKR